MAKRCPRMLEKVTFYILVNFVSLFTRRYETNYTHTCLRYEIQVKNAIGRILEKQTIHTAWHKFGKHISNYHVMIEPILHYVWPIHPAQLKLVDKFVSNWTGCFSVLPAACNNRTKFCTTAENFRQKLWPSEAFPMKVHVTAKYTATILYWFYMFKCKKNLCSCAILGKHYRYKRPK